MKRKIASLLILAMLLAATTVCAAALTPADFNGGAPSGLAVTDDGLLVTDVYYKVIWKVTDGQASILAGQISPAGLDGEPEGVYDDGTLETALFMEPWAIAPFLNGWAVSDAEANVVRFVDATGVRTAAGNGTKGASNGVGERVSFHRPTGLAEGDDGELYIADSGNGSIRRMDSRGTVTTVLTGLAEPTGLCFADGALYIAETGRNRILRFVDGRTEVLAGESISLGDGQYQGGYQEGPADKARFDHPQGVAVDEDGTVYIADTGNHAVRRLADGRVTTVASADQDPGTPAAPRGLALQDGELLVADSFEQTVLSLSTEGESYGDVPAGRWYTGIVKEATRRGLVSGTGEGNFSPDRPVTRAMFVVMLANVERTTDRNAFIGGETSFADVAENTWYASAVSWAADNGIAAGSQGRFRPSDAIKRQDLAVMLYHYAKGIGLDTSARADLTAFADGGQVSAYAVDAMSWAVAQGIFSGNANGTLAPRSTATRAQTAAILVNFMDGAGI